MPNMKNAKKRVLVNIKKEKANNEFEASMKTAIKNVERDRKNTPSMFLNHLNVIIPLKIPIDVGIPPPLRFGIFLYI